MKILFFFVIAFTGGLAIFAMIAIISLDAGHTVQPPSVSMPAANALNAPRVPKALPNPSPGKVDRLQEHYNTMSEQLDRLNACMSGAIEQEPDDATFTIASLEAACGVPQGTYAAACAEGSDTSTEDCLDLERAPMMKRYVNAK